MKKRRIKTMVRMNKNGNASYQGSFAGVRYYKGKFYAPFGDDHSYVREVPQGKGVSTSTHSMTMEKFEKLPRVTRI